MKKRSFLLPVAFLANISPSLACELNGLTEAIDRLKGGKEPDARYAAEYCAKILQGNTDGNVAPLILLLGTVVDKDERLKEAVRNCPVEMYKRAC